MTDDDSLPSSDAFPKTKAKILIVDDRLENLLALEVLLAGVDAHLVRAGSGSEALALCLESDFALILLDVQMPGMDGYEVVELLRKSRSTRHVPVIFISAVFSGDYYNIKGIEAGAVDFIAKPIIPAVLLGKVRFFLESYEQKMELRWHRNRLEEMVRRRTRELESELAERKRVEGELQNTQATFQAAMDQSSAGIAIADAPDGRLRYVNRAGLMIRGAPPEMIVDGVGLNEYVASWQLFALDGRPLEREEVPLARALLYNEPASREFIVRREKEDDRIVIANAAPIHNADGQVVSAVVVFTDITERRQAELVNEKLAENLMNKHEELLQFTYTICHDLKSPVVTIKSFLGMLEMDMKADSKENVAVDFDHLNHAADRMEQMLLELQNLSSLGRSTNRLEHFSFKELVNDVFKLLAGKLAETETEVVVTDDASLFADRSRILELLQNLLENSLKYMGGQPSPRIEIGSQWTPDKRVFYVKDNGAGVEPEYQEKIFGLFEKLDRQTPGSGIGLALVKRIVNQHGGRVWVESAGQGQGSCFFFTLPAALVEGEEAKARAITA